MHLSTLLPCVIAMASTAAKAQNVQLYSKALFQGDTWAFTGDPYVCAKVDQIVYGNVNSAVLVYSNPPSGFYCRLYTFIKGQ
ncbi:hypothetical protein V8C37DRAFT_372781 [Trichoderma ceciliae]